MKSINRAIAAAIWAGAATLAEAAESPGNPGQITLIYDESSEVARLLVPVREGRVVWGDVLRGLARARGFDDEALDGLWPSKHIKVTGASGRAAIAGINRILGPGIDLQLTRDDAGADWLEIALDRRALLASERRFKQRSKRVFQAAGPDARVPYGLKCDRGWADAPAEKSLVVLVHGLQSGTEKISGILDDVRKLGFPCATLDYPNDQAIEQSAQLLARELARLAAEHPDRKVVLVTRSMGGLVARAVVEDPRLNPGNVERLIMVAPPNGGSVLAHFAFGLDLWEFLVNPKEREPAERFFSLIEDGLGEAPDDLRPGSLFLERLNSRPRNPNVRYSILLGTDGPLSQASLDGIRLSLKQAGARSRYVRFFGGKLDGDLADLDEVVRGKGDGAVAVKRGMLAGVEDVELLPFDHLTLPVSEDSPGAAALRNAIVKRISRPVASPRGS